MSVRANRSVALNILSFVLQEVSFFVFLWEQAKREKRKEKKFKDWHKGKKKEKKNEKTTREKNLSTFDKKSNTG